MKKLQGTEKQIEWADSIRHKCIKSALEYKELLKNCNRPKTNVRFLEQLVMLESFYKEKFSNYSQITSAAKIIDQRFDGVFGRGECMPTGEYSTDPKPIFIPTEFKERANTEK